MTKSTRMFELIQMLRAADGPVLARDLGRALEVSTRTIYRDIAALQAMRTPIEGAAGIGYVMRRGYDLPPVNFDADEAEAVKIGLSMIARTGDEALWQAALRAARKLKDATPGKSTLIASSWGVMLPAHIDVADIRRAIGDECVMALSYADVDGAVSHRDIWPLALIYYAENAVLVAWCVLRADFRHFRLDRMQACTRAATYFSGKGAALRDEWETQHKHATVNTR